MAVWALGINHNTAPLDLRGRFAFALDQIAPTLQGLRQALGESDAHRGVESAIISTCNRTEIYCAGNHAALDHTLDWLARSGGVSSGCVGCGGVSSGGLGCRGGTVHDSLLRVEASARVGAGSPVGRRSGAADMRLRSREYVPGDPRPRGSARAFAQGHLDGPVGRERLLGRFAHRGRGVAIPGGG